MRVSKKFFLAAPAVLAIAVGAIAATNANTGGDWSAKRVARLQEKLGLTFIIVTHDQQEAMTVADRIGVMDQGRLMQVATPQNDANAEESMDEWVDEIIARYSQRAHWSKAKPIESPSVVPRSRKSSVPAPANGSALLAPP